MRWTLIAGQNRDDYGPAGIYQLKDELDAITGKLREVAAAIS
ncbi:MAG: hypothetical protein Q7U98_07050 [Methylicorpusculum sp.]|nr:hypothetical protein [Methylicorpusculum sp.]MDO8845143.1 hypothetical protein [Methylicorpusculum sp.]MDO8938900.1 hypothetical protein [Methylicorpusculum sp.]MDP2178000.1 hypothetical protein [Methylicorpusculum sp.]MDP2204657.1 hypothetical protein [Methylicorpusculum sp.]